MKAIAACWILVVVAPSMHAQVVLSRRVYAEHGRTFAQIWMADAGALNFRQLTDSARDHSEPVCSLDGRLIYFVSDHDALRSRNSYGGHPEEREVWAYDRQTGRERLIWRTSRGLGLDLNGTTANGGPLVTVGAELRNLAPDPWAIDNVDDAAVSPDGRRLALIIAASYDQDGQSRNPRLFVADAATGRPRTLVGNYAVPEWSPDGARLAASDGGLAILDAATRREIQRVALPKPDAPVQDIVWSPDGKSLLAGLYGENGGAGDPQNDYFLLNPATRTWTPALTARQLLWLHGETVLYLRPFATTPLAPASPHSVWTSQLAVYDLASHQDTPLTSGLVLNDYLSTCGR